MAFNTKKTINSEVRSNNNVTVNFEGGIAFEVTPKMELFLRVASAMVGQPKFYTDKHDSDNGIINLIKKIGKEDPEFIFKLALYTREKLYLRSTPVMIVTELLNSFNKIPHSKNWVASIIQRPDEIAEMLAYQFKLNKERSYNKKHIPSSMKRGIACSFEKFDEYQFSKYNNSGKEISIRDAMFLTHPKPKTQERIELYRKIANNELKPAETWETALMVAGEKKNDIKYIKETWEKILPKMGYMAILRNVRNFLKYGVDPEMYVPRICDPDFIRNSKQFPYRFYSAWKSVANMKKDIPNPEDISYVMNGLSRALHASVANVRKLPGITFVAIDLSGSMDSPLTYYRGMLNLLSKREMSPSQVTRKNVAALFGSIVNSFSERSIISAFGEDFKLITLSSDDILVNMREIESARVGHSTNAWKAIHYLNSRSKLVDRIVIFSDEVVYDDSCMGTGPMITPPREAMSLIEELVKYQRNINPNVFIYSVDLGGYGFSSIPTETKNTSKIAGFSDKIFDYISLFESDRNTMLNDIEHYSYS